MCYSGKVRVLVSWVLFLSILIFFTGQPIPSWAVEKEKSYDLSSAIIRIARETIPAVVHIEVTERQEVVNPMTPFESDPFFRRFFNIPQMPKKFKRELKGIGTGMIMDSQGHILTNHHVVGGATKIEVLLSDGRRYPGQVVGTDPKTDLAVIKISAKEPLPHVVFGDSDKVEVGEWVVAIGHPRGLDQTVTQGIISAKHRRGIMDPSSYQDFLQTDAAINPGNSGGPLIDLSGKVIGVNAVIVSESGGFEGIGFTIPINIAQHVSRALIAHGKVERGWLGVTIRDLTPDLAKKVQVQSPKGALIEEVVKGGPAEKAGIRKNDVVVAFRGKEILDSGAFQNAVGDSPIGTEAKITIFRKDQKQEFTVKIGNLEVAKTVLAAEARNRLGIKIREPNALEVSKYGLSSKQGVVITWIDPHSPLKGAGFEVGDMILAINNQPVENVEGLVDLVTLLKPKQKVSLTALDHRTGNTGTILVVIH